MYGNDGVEDPPSGFGVQVFIAATDLKDISLPFLNPQTRMNVVGAGVEAASWQPEAQGRGRGRFQRQDDEGGASEARNPGRPRSGSQPRSVALGRNGAE